MVSPSLLLPPAPWVIYSVPPCRALCAFSNQLHQQQWGGGTVCCCCCCLPCWLLLKQLHVIGNRLLHGSHQWFQCALPAVDLQVNRSKKYKYTVLVKSVSSHRSVLERGQTEHTLSQLWGHGTLEQWNCAQHSHTAGKSFFFFKLHKYHPIVAALWLNRRPAHMQLRRGWRVNWRQKSRRSDANLKTWSATTELVHLLDEPVASTLAAVNRRAVTD